MRWPIGLRILTMAALLIGVAAAVIWGPLLLQYANEQLAQTHTTVVKRGAVLTIRGPLSRQAVERVRRLDLAGVRTIRISSDQGSEDAGLDLAELVEPYDVNLIVFGTCSGPCAQYVFIAAEEKTIEGNGLVSCGPNILAGARIPETAYGSSFSQEELRLAERARNLYRQAGVSEGYALNCLSLVLPICADTYANRRGIQTARPVWLPLHDHFVEFGILNVVGAAQEASDLPVVLRRPGKWDLTDIARDPAELAVPTQDPLPADFLEHEIPTLRRCLPGSVQPQLVYVPS